MHVDFICDFLQQLPTYIQEPFPNFAIKSYTMCLIQCSRILKNYSICCAKMMFHSQYEMYVFTILGSLVTSQEQPKYSMPAWFDDDAQEDPGIIQGPFHVAK